MITLDEQLLKSGRARFGEDEPIPVVRQSHHTEKARDERDWTQTEHGQRSRNGTDAHRSRRQHASHPAEWTEARHETQPAVR